MIAKIIIDILFVFSIIGTTSYFVSAKNDNKKLLKIGRYSYNILLYGIILISGYLMYLIITHDFQFTYVWNYSSTELPFHLLISTFYAGQEGSFMLWTLFVVIVGAFLMPYAKRKGYESLAMGLYSLILTFLLLILIVKSPFNYVWDSFPDVEVGFMPNSGRGLNPILENPWIVIHPPILFIGYAAMSVPYVFAVSALIKKDYANWISIATPWVLVSAGILGLGIGLGGFWAYETLGWGGFWGWDPVENSSLLPWLISMALVHTMLVQRSTGGLAKTNFLLAILSFIYVLYATFLTRSGILGDISVHSFVDPGNLVYALLLIFILLFLVIGMVFLFYRFNSIDKEKINFSLTSRESMVSIGAILLLISTAIVFIGTSMPIFLELTGQPKTAVEIAFYDKWNLPVAVLFLITCGFSFYTNWKSKKISGIVKIIIPFVVSAIATYIVYLVDVTEVQHLILAYASFYCLYNSILFSLNIIKKNPKMLGGYISHAGLGIFFLGVIFSGGYETSKSLTLHQGESAEVLGYNVTFLGSDRIEKEKKDREKYKCNIKIQQGDDFSFVGPIVYWSDFNQKQSPFFEPGIDVHLTKDIYVSPKALSYENDMPSIVLAKDETAKIPYDSSWSIKLLEFDMSHGTANDPNKPFKFGAIVQMSKSYYKFKDTLFVNLDMSSGNSAPIWKKFRNTDISIGFSNFNINSEDMTQSQALISFSKEGVTQGGKEVFTFVVTLKPLISFVWVGSLAVIFGFFVAMFRYRKVK